MTASTPSAKISRRHFPAPPLDVVMLAMLIAAAC